MYCFAFQYEVFPLEESCWRPCVYMCVFSLWDGSVLVRSMWRKFKSLPVMLCYLWERYLSLLGFGFCECLYTIFVFYLVARERMLKAEPCKSLVFSVYVIVSIFLSDFLCSHFLLGYLSQAHNIFTINLVWECFLEALLQQIGIKTFTIYNKKDIAYDQFFYQNEKL